MRTPVALSVLAFFGRFTLVISCVVGVILLFVELGTRPALGEIPTHQFNWLTLLIAAGIVLQGLLIWAVCEAIVLIGHSVLAIHSTVIPEPEPEHYMPRRVSATKAARTRT